MTRRGRTGRPSVRPVSPKGHPTGPDMMGAAVGRCTDTADRRAVPVLALRVWPDALKRAGQRACSTARCVCLGTHDLIRPSAAGAATTLIARGRHSEQASVETPRGPLDTGLRSLCRGPHRCCSTGSCAGTPERIRTAVTALRGRRPGPLDDGGRTCRTQANAGQEGPGTPPGGAHRRRCSAGGRSLQQLGGKDSNPQ
jgi:hypothetical protein